MRKRIGIIASFALVAAAALVVPSGQALAQEAGGFNFTQPVTAATGLNVPWSFAFAPGARESITATAARGFEQASSSADTPALR